MSLIRIATVLPSGKKSGVYVTTPGMSDPYYCFMNSCERENEVGPTTNVYLTEEELSFVVRSEIRQNPKFRKMVRDFLKRNKF